MINHLKSAAVLAGVAALAIANAGLSAQTSASEVTLGAPATISTDAPVTEVSEHTLASTAFFDGINVSAIAVGAYE